MEITFYRTLANKLADKVVENDTYTDNEIKRIRYGLICIFSDLYKFLLLLVVFSLFSATVEFLVAFTAILLLRPFIAGYHAKSEIMCIVVSLATMLISVLAGRINIIPHFMEIAMIVVLPILGAVISPARLKKPEDNLPLLKILSFIATLLLLLGSYFLFSTQIVLISVLQVYILALWHLLKMQILKKKVIYTHR